MLAATLLLRAAPHFARWKNSEEQLEFPMHAVTVRQTSCYRSTQLHQLP